MKASAIVAVLTLLMQGPLVVAAMVCLDRGRGLLGTSLLIWAAVVTTWAIERIHDDYKDTKKRRSE